MMTKFLRMGVIVAGAALAFGSVSACADDSTASAPITSEPITTTSMYASAPSASSGSPSSARPSADDRPSASEAPAGDTGRPATAPPADDNPPRNDAGGEMQSPNGAPLNDKAKKYLQTLKEQNASFANDDNNAVALSAAEYVCAQQRKNADPTTVRAFVTALAGSSGAKDTADANARADKVIKAARADYC